MTAGGARPGEAKTRDGRTARLTVWNRLFHGIPVELEELGSESLRGDPAWPEDCGAYVMLRACVVIAGSARRAVRYALRPAILYWFSNVSDCPAEGRALRPSGSSFHLGEAIGKRLTWDEAVAAVDRKPIDYAAYTRVLEIVQDEYVRQWASLFPGTEPVSIAPMFRPDRQTRLSRPWQPDEHPEEPYTQ